MARPLSKPGSGTRESSFPMTEGSIMATIMESHMERNIAADSGQPWPGIRIHIMDIRHPPGMSIPPDMEKQK